MLGTAITELTSLLSRRGVYSGYLCNGPAKGKPAYILASKTPCEQFDCTVIALAPQPGGKEVKIIVAPENDIFYEPQIREKLKIVRNLDISRLSCLYEKSCGAVVFYRVNCTA